MASDNFVIHERPQLVRVKRLQVRSMIKKWKHWFLKNCAFQIHICTNLSPVVYVHECDFTKFILCEFKWFRSNIPVSQFPLKVLVALIHHWKVGWQEIWFACCRIIMILHLFYQVKMIGITWYKVYGSDYTLFVSERKIIFIMAFCSIS